MSQGRGGPAGACVCGSQLVSLHHTCCPAVLPELPGDCRGGAVSRRAPPFPSRAAWFRVGVSRWPDELSRTDASLLLRKEGWGPQDERRPARAPQSAAAENEACLYLVT